MKSNGSSDNNGGYSTGWNARRSLHILKMSLTRPTPLPIVNDDSDEEMEIDENDVEMPCVQAASKVSPCVDRLPADLTMSKENVRPFIYNSNRFLHSTQQMCRSKLVYGVNQIFVFRISS